MRISYYNIGCKVNFAEISQIRKQFELLGHETVEFGQITDAVIINTCSVTNMADSDCRKIIRRALRYSPDAFIGVLGCYAQLKPEDIAKIDGVDAVFGIKEKFSIPDIISDFRKKGKAQLLVSNLEDLPFHTACSVDNESHTRMVLKLQDGCDYSCTYCTIPNARGGSRSMPFGELKSKIIELNETDYYEIILSGINLGEYKAPTEERFIDVIKFIENSGVKQRFRISSIEPNLITPELIEIVKNSKTVCPHFHIPLQSGSPEILKLMRRRYDAESFRELIIYIKEKIPDCCIGVDVISGFPGETGKHFEETFNLLESLPVSYLHPFTFSERDNTPAATFPGIVPHDIRKSRTVELRKLSDTKKALFYNSQVGTVRTAIPEQFDKENGAWKGWTENYVHVEFSGVDLPQVQPNSGKKPLKLELVECSGDFVRGRVLSVR